VRGASVDAQVVRYGPAGARRRRDRLAGEEPLEIRVEGLGQPAVRVAVTMRTPGADFDLAAGFLFTEGLLDAPHEIAAIKYCTDVDRSEQEFNVVTVHLRRPFDPSSLQRNFYATSSCGVCGKASIDQIEVACAPLAPGPVVEPSLLLGLPERLRDRQPTFDVTGGLHAAGLFTAAGDLVELREDVGRHNALDKVIGARFGAGGTPLSDHIVLVSGRAGFELVQKAAVAGIPLLAAVGAPSSLAVDAARRLGVTVVGFLRGDGFNVYSHPERVAAAS
jgi:FdhD protein